MTREELDEMFKKYTMDEDEPAPRVRPAAEQAGQRQTQAGARPGAAANAAPVRQRVPMRQSAQPGGTRSNGQPSRQPVQSVQRRNAGTHRAAPASRAGASAGASGISAAGQNTASGGRKPPARHNGTSVSSGGGISRGLKLLAYVVCCLTASVFLAFFVLDAASDLFGLNQPNAVVEIELPDQPTASQIADLLYDQEIITSKWVFQLYSGLKGHEDRYKGGRYSFNQNLSYDEIISKIKTGSIILEEVRITFYEGMTTREMAALLEEKRVCKAQDFLDRLAQGDFGRDFEQTIPENSYRFNPYEGYLFPNTYDFFVGENIDSVIKKFFNSFEQNIDEIILDKIEESGMTLDEVVILASVIQTEASMEDQMRWVSSVFHNRLAQGSPYPKLQSDVTINYVENYIKPFVTGTDAEENQKMYDAYNTYVCDGLPAGPVCNPGKAAIEAALLPESSNYYFFLTDANDKYYYARNFEEHQRNMAAAAQVGIEHGTGTVE